MEVTDDFFLVGTRAESLVKMYVFLDISSSLDVGITSVRKMVPSYITYKVKTKGILEKVIPAQEKKNSISENDVGK